MNFFDKPKFYGVIIIVLLLLNSATLAFMWLHRPGPPPHMEFQHDPNMTQGRNEPRPGEFLIHELNLNDSQLTDFIKLRDEHQSATIKIEQDIKNNKDEMFKMLGSAQTDSSKLNQITDNLAKDQKQIEMALYNHFSKVRSLCDDSQKKKFDNIIGDVMKMMGGPPHGPQGPPPGPPR